MLHLSRNPQIRQQKRAAQLGDPVPQTHTLRNAKLIAFFTIEAGRCTRPVNQLMQAGGVEVRRVREAGTAPAGRFYRWPDDRTPLRPCSVGFCPAPGHEASACGSGSKTGNWLAARPDAQAVDLFHTLNTVKAFSIGIFSISPSSSSSQRLVKMAVVPCSPLRTPPPSSCAPVCRSRQRLVLKTPVLPHYNTAA